MRTVPLVAALAALLCVSGLGALALAPSAGVLHFPDAPARAHTPLGEVRVLLRVEPDAELAPVPLAVAARARYGRVDALRDVRFEPLPCADGAMIFGVAIRWN